jgi:TPR repeat protein
MAREEFRGGNLLAGTALEGLDTAGRDAWRARNVDAGVLGRLREEAMRGRACAERALALALAGGLDGAPVDRVAAARLFLSAAGKGYAPAQAVAGDMYRGGDGVARSPAEALRLYLLAADGGDASGMAGAAMMLLDGDGVTADPDEGIALLTRALALENDPAQYYAARMYAAGSHVPQSDERSMEFVRASAEGGYRPAQEALNGSAAAR